MSAPTKRSYPDVRTKSQVEVVGDLIAEARSESRPGSTRYTKIDVFRLEDRGGKPAWCVVTVGISRIFHDANHPCRNAAGKPYGQKSTWDDLLKLEERLESQGNTQFYVECERCFPGRGNIEYDGQDPVYIEVDKARISVVDNGDALYDALCGFDPKRGVKFMSDVGRSAWMQVQGCDPDVGEHTVRVS